MAAGKAQGSRAGSIQQPPRPELNTIVQRMEQASRENRERYRAYVITREYRLYGSGDQNPSSKVSADVSFVPPNTKEFTITKSEGSSRGETIVQHILEAEQKNAATGQSALSRDNYDFKLEGEGALDGHDCFVLGLNPKRKEKSLIIGLAWVDKNTYLVHRMQGQLAKMPSWWIKSVEVTVDFSDVSGMWLHTHTSASANVRIVGQQTLQENAVKIRAGAMVADATPRRLKTARRPVRRPQAIIGSFQR